MREVIYDTETTGKRHGSDKIVEIAAIELVDGAPTGRVFHKLINPERDIPDEVVAVHGITNEKVKDAPTFREIMPELIEFFRGARAVAHNSEFDEKFINEELKAADHKESFWSIVGDTVDTLRLSRQIWIGKNEKGVNYKHSLDAILDRCEIDRTHRVLHGALLDAELLKQAYLVMKAKKAEMGPGIEDDVPRAPIRRIDLSSLTLPMVPAPQGAPTTTRSARP